MYVGSLVLRKGSKQKPRSVLRSFFAHNRRVSVLGGSSPRTLNAFQSGVSVPDYVRGLVHDHILQRGAAFREKGAALRPLINAGKAWVITYHECEALSAGEIEPYAPATNTTYLSSPGQHLVATMAGQTKVRSTSQQSEIYRETVMPYVMLKYAPPG